MCLGLSGWVLNSSAHAQKAVESCPRGYVLGRLQSSWGYPQQSSHWSHFHIFSGLSLLNPRLFWDLWYGCFLLAKDTEAGHVLEQDQRVRAQHPYPGGSSRLFWFSVNVRGAWSPVQWTSTVSIWVMMCGFPLIFLYDYI